MTLRLGTRCAAPFVVAALLAVLVGCGGDDDEGGAGAPATDGAERTAVTVQDVAGIWAEFLTAGVKQGFFAKRGLDVSVKTAAGGAAIILAVVERGRVVRRQQRRLGRDRGDEGLAEADRRRQTFRAADRGRRAGRRCWSSSGSPSRSAEDLQGRTMAVQPAGQRRHRDGGSRRSTSLGADGSEVEVQPRRLPPRCAGDSERRPRRVRDRRSGRSMTAGLKQVPPGSSCRTTGHRPTSSSAPTSLRSRARRSIDDIVQASGRRRRHGSSVREPR